MRLPKLLNPLVTKEALVGWALAFHQKIWRMIQVGGDVDFVATYSQKLFDLLQHDITTWSVILFGVGLILHSYHRTRPSKEERADTPVHPTNDTMATSSLEPKSALTESSQEQQDVSDMRSAEFDPRGLYIGNIDIDHRFIDERRVLTIMVSGFNASGCSIDIREVRGGLKANVKTLVYTPCATLEGVLDFGEMLSPSVGRWTCELTDIQNYSEFFFKIMQNVPASLLDEIKTTEQERVIALDLTELDVMAYPTDGNSKGYRLPLWGGVNFHLSSSEWLRVHKVVSARPPIAGA